MPFTCYSCHLPFDHGKPNPAGQLGAGDGQQEKTVSATKCGHLFHSECLKKQFEKLSQNAWTAKPCPACNYTLGVQDIQRVQGCSIDARTSKGPELEKLLEAKKKLHKDNNELIKRLEASYNQNKMLIMEVENERRQKEDQQARIEQVMRLSAIHASDLERYKNETEKLKNIIITLTARLTGNAVEDDFNNGLTSAHTQRLVWSAEDTPAFGLSNGNNAVPNNNECARVQNIGHPPGLTLIATPSLPWNSETPSPSSGGLPSVEGGRVSNVNVNHGSVASGNSDLTGLTNKMLYPFPGKPTIFDYEISESNGRNGGHGGNGVPSRWDSMSPISNSNWRTGPKDKEKSPGGWKEVNNASAGKSAGCESKLNKHSEKTSLASKESEEQDYLLNEDLDLENSGNWTEKRSKRRPGSKGRTHNSSASKSDHSKEKQLYGWFKCTTCNAKWGSSHTFVNQPQTCRYCKTECHPFDQGPVLPRRQLDELNKSKKDES